MAIDAWGRWIPDQYNPQYYRDDLMKQREAIDRQLSEIDKRYQPVQAPQTLQNPPVSSVDQTLIKQELPYILVDSEKEAFDYPIINKLDDDIGKVHIFVMKDESAAFFTRINPSTFDKEFEAYDKRNKSKPIDSISNEDEDLLVSIDTRLQKIEGIVDTAVSMFMSGNANKAKSNKSTSKTVTPPIVIDSIETSSDEEGED